jgi:hypothetical protein
MTNDAEIPVDEVLDVPEHIMEQSIEFESHFSDTSAVVIDRFPFAGATIPPPTQGQGGQIRATSGDSIWAPFRSERDWNVARWAKTHHTSSSAVNDFLAIPEVCAARSNSLCS